MKPSPTGRCLYSHAFACVCGAPPNSSSDPDPQEPELVPRLGGVQSHRREDATLARPEPHAREAADQEQHQQPEPQETTGQAVQLVSRSPLPSAPPSSCPTFTVFTSLLFFVPCCAVTTKTKIISQKPLRPSLPRVQENQDLPAHWTNRSNRLYTHR